MPVFHMPISSTQLTLLLINISTLGFYIVQLAVNISLSQPIQPWISCASWGAEGQAWLCNGVVFMIFLFSLLGCSLAQKKGLDAAGRAAPTVLLGLFRFSLDLKELQRGTFIAQTLIVLDTESQNSFFFFPIPKQILDSYS